jgi:hypothetical protein
MKEFEARSGNPESLRIVAKKQMEVFEKRPEESIRFCVMCINMAISSGRKALVNLLIN